MALIKCPECGNEVSDQAEACIKCGYPIKDFVNQRNTKYADDKVIKNEIDKIYASNCTNEEKYQSLNEIALQKPHWLVYNWMSIVSDDDHEVGSQNTKRAIDCFEKALTFEDADVSIIYYNLGRAYFNLANIESRWELWEKGINTLNKSSFGRRNYLLGRIYDPYYENYKFPRKDLDTAINYYLKSLQEFDEPFFRSLALNALGCRFGNKGSDLGGAIYTFLATRYYDDPQYKHNYESFITRYNKKTNGKMRKRIEMLQTPAEAAQLIDDIQMGKACPTCGFSTITTGARGFGGFWGHIGATQTVNRCSTCGYTWSPKL